MAAAARVLADLPGVAFLSTLRRANVHGALDMGLAPGLLAGSASTPAGPGMSTIGQRPCRPRRVGRGGHHGGGQPGLDRGAGGLGADPCADFPDARLALQAMHGARFVVAVDTHLTASSRLADVVLPAAAWAERRGSFTNLEDRITRLGQLVTARGSAWPDWVIASELAARLGIDLGFSSLQEIWEEIARVSPLHRDVEPRVLYSDAAREGVLGPPGVRTPLRPAASSRLTPWPTPASTPRSCTTWRPPPCSTPRCRPSPSLTAPAARRGPVASTGGPAAPAVAAAGREGAAPAIPAMLGLPEAAQPRAAPAPEPGALRLVTRRTLWMGAPRCSPFPTWRSLRPAARVVVHPSVLADLGTAEGELVGVVSGAAPCGCLPPVTSRCRRE